MTTTDNDEVQQQTTLREETSFVASKHDEPAVDEKKELAMMVGDAPPSVESSSELENSASNEEKPPSSPENESLVKKKKDEGEEAALVSTKTTESSTAETSDKEKGSSVEKPSKPCVYDLVEDNEEEDNLKKRWSKSTSLAISNVNDRERAEENESAQSMRSPRSHISAEKQNQNKGKYVWDRIPRESKPEIFWFLQLKELCTCVQFDQWDQLAWNHRKSHYMTNRQVLSDRDVIGMCQAYPHLRVLHLSQCIKLTDASLKHISSSLFNLVRLHLAGCYQITDYGIQYLAQGFGRAVSNYPTGLPRTESMPAAHKRSQSLPLEASRSTMNVSANKSQLRSLELEFCHLLTDFGMKRLSAMSDLTALYLTGMRQVTDIGVSHLTKSLVHLCTLHLSYCPKISDVAIEFIIATNKRTNKERLFDKDTEKENLQNHLLLDLRLSYCGKITDNGLNQIAAGLPSLLTLRIEGSSHITDAGVTEVCSKLTKLKALSLSHSPHITDESLRAISTSLSNLNTLDVEDCHGISDNGLSFLTIGSPQIKFLNILGCTKITSTHAHSTIGLPVLHHAPPFCHRSHSSSAHHPPHHRTEEIVLSDIEDEPTQEQ